MEPAWKRSVIKCKPVSREARTIPSAEFWAMYQFERAEIKPGITDKDITKLRDADTKRRK